MIKLTDIAWLGGILEGEAWFGLKERKYPQIRLGMTASDTVIKAASILGLRTYRCKTSWILEIRGVKAIEWMMTLYPFLGKDRRSTIARIICHWKSYPFARAPNGTSFAATCHPNRPFYSINLCQECYDRQSYIKRKNRRRLTVEQWKEKVGT